MSVQPFLRLSSQVKKRSASSSISHLGVPVHLEALDVCQSVFYNLAPLSQMRGVMHRTRGRVVQHLGSLVGLLERRLSGNLIVTINTRR
jgi:hypothetical protein